MVLSSTISLIRDRYSRSAFSQLLDLPVGSRKGGPFVSVLLDIQSSYDDPASFRLGDRYLAAKLILLVLSDPGSGSPVSLIVYLSRSREEKKIGWTRSIFEFRLYR